MKFNSRIIYSTPFIFLIVNFKIILRGCDEILDLGCGELSPIRFLSAYKVGVDGFKPSLTKAKKSKTHNKFYFADLNKIDKIFPDKSFDAVVLIDVIEHFNKKDGLRLIKRVERIARKRVLIYTPNGYLPQYNSKNKLQEHLSGWNVDEFIKLGFKVKGIQGHKFFRGKYHKIKQKPEFIWFLFSEISSYFYSFHKPNSAAALLAYKKIT